MENILIVDRNIEAAKELKEELEKEEVIRSVKIVSEGDKAVNCLRRGKYDVIITDLILANVDGIGVIEEAKHQNAKCKIVVISAIKNEEIIQTAINKGANYYFIKPYKKEIILERIKEMICGRVLQSIERLNEPESAYVYLKNKEISNEYKLETLVINAIHMIDVPHKLKGFQYLKEAIMLMIQNNKPKNTITKDIYPDIALLHKTTPTRVERGIRNAIDASWPKGKYKFMDFTKTDFNEKAPTNTEYIVLLADKIKLEMKQFAQSPT